MNAKRYYISINEERIEVTKEQYLCYYRAERRMRYFEKDIKSATAIHDKNGNFVDYRPSKEDSLERLISKGRIFADEQESIEEVVITAIQSGKLYKALDKLDKEEHELINALYFSNDGDGMSEREYAKANGIPRKTLAYRRKKILDKLKKYMNS